MSHRIVIIFLTVTPQSRGNWPLTSKPAAGICHTESFVFFQPVTAIYYSTCPNLWDPAVSIAYCQFDLRGFLNILSHLVIYILCSVAFLSRFWPCIWCQLIDHDTLTNTWWKRSSVFDTKSLSCIPTQLKRWYVLANSEPKKGILVIIKRRWTSWFAQNRSRNYLTLHRFKKKWSLTLKLNFRKNAIFSSLFSFYMIYIFLHMELPVYDFILFCRQDLFIINFFLKFINTVKCYDFSHGTRSWKLRVISRH